MKKILKEFKCLCSGNKKISPWRESGCVKQRELQPQERVKKTITSPSADSAAVSLSLMRRGKKAAFTLAETMIVIVVLGIIATLTIPALVNKNKESVAKTKVRKAMAAYESALNKMIIENDLKSHETLTAWAGANCANSTSYFKKVQGDGCIFKTSDGIWWDISNIERPLIAFNQDNLTTEKANNANDKTAFVLVGRFGADGSLRVDDLAYETNHDEDNSKAQVEKLYSLIGIKGFNNQGNEVVELTQFGQCREDGADTCTVNGVTYTKRSINDASITNYGSLWGGGELCKYENGEQICGYTSEAQSGTLYVAYEGFPSDWYTEAHNYEGSTCESCKMYDTGDYYNAAKRHCAKSGGRLATASELIGMGIANSGNYWAMDDRDPDTASCLYYGSPGFNSKNDTAGDHKVLCVGVE